MAKFEGFVNKITTRDGKSKKPPYKPWTLYSFILETQDGSETPWISFGFEKPPFAEGEYISFETDEKDGHHNYRKGSGSKPANPPERSKARTSNSQSNPANAKAGLGSGASAASSAGSGSQSADRQTSIVMQHSQEMAILAAGVLLTHNALPMSGAASKAGEAKRFSEITAMIDKLTVKYYNDAATGRLLETVADTVIDTAPDAPLPASKKKDAPKSADTPTDDDLGGSPEERASGF